jgi:flagellin
MEVDLSSVASNGDDMTDVATALQSAINASISNYNSITGKVDGQPGFLKDVAVTVTDDGRLSITSESGPVTLTDRNGDTDVTDLGLNNAQTSAAGNGGMTLQIGANQNQTLTFGINDMRSAALGISGTIVSTQTGAESAITYVDKAISKVSDTRSQLGAIQNRLEHTMSNLGTTSQNLTSSESQITDVDMASEMMQYTKNSILSQAATAMLAQANQAPQQVLQLLK